MIFLKSVLGVLNILFSLLLTLLSLIVLAFIMFAEVKTPHDDIVYTSITFSGAMAFEIAFIRYALFIGLLLIAYGSYLWYLKANANFLKIPVEEFNKGKFL